ncbi:hypothetical protein FRC08_002273 [Ceratobasidium sp. 394]|nr:hypothetical protein FRC08_002273 [Ceratobasidium sp. 394]KAG9094858.1 hypothetical protein FS749_011693 [Ceratobasidium sp. UAMH 11750]
MHRIFETPELLCIICGNLPPSNRAALVSRHFFRGMLPYLFQRTSIYALFKRGLIPAEWTLRDREMTVTRISQPLSSENMSRFHLYAPSIKYLNFDPGAYSLKVRNWEPLISYSQTTQLLPNLVESSCSQAGSRSCFVFLSHSTRVLKVYKYSGPSDGVTTSELLGHVANKCPNIRELEYHCELDEPIEGESAENRSLRTFASLPAFRNLCCLVSSPAIIQSSALQLLSQLPKLADLWIRAESGIRPWVSSLREQLPPGSFPALKTLSVDFEKSGDVKKFWEFIPLAGLEKAYISIGLIGDGDQSEFIPTLCQASPNIKHLRLTFSIQSELDEEDREIHRISVDMFEHLARLPLDNFLSLGCARLDFDDAWARIAQLWPSLGEINCIHQPMRLDELMLLSAALPNLHRVECDLDLEQAMQVVERNWQPVIGYPFYPSLRFLIVKEFELREYASSFHHDLSDLARFFAYFWPSVHVESIKSYTHDVDEYETDTWKYNQALFDMLQKLIRAHVQSVHP